MRLLFRSNISIFAIMLTAASVGFGAEPLPDHLPITSMHGIGLMVVPLYTREQCEEILLPIAEPAVVIGKGLSALNATARAETAGCLSEVVNLWEKAAPELAPDQRQLIGDDYFQDPAYLALRDRQRQITDEMDCTPPADPAEHERFMKTRSFLCKAGFFPRDTLAAKAQEDKELRAKIQVLEASGQLRQSFPSMISELLLPLPQEPSSLVNLRSQVRCFDMPKLVECHTASAAGESAEALKKALAEESDKFAAATNIRQRRRTMLQEFLSVEDEFDPRLDRAELRFLHERFRCLESGRYPPFSEYCTKVGRPVMDTTAPVLSELSKFRSGAEALADELLAHQPAAEARWLSKRRLKTKDVEEKYGLRRLLSQYHAYSRRGGGGRSLKAFCEENDRSQRTMARYADKFGLVVPFVRDTYWRWANLYGLTEGELAAVQNYTGSYFEDINRALWNEKAAKGAAPLEEDKKVFKEMLDQALTKGPTHEQRVTRFASLPAAVLARHKVGTVVTYDAYTSTSAKPDWTWGGDSEAPVHRFLIFGKSGVNISELSTSEQEDEVLFPAGTRFKVLSRKPRPGQPKAFDFVMAEVDAKGRVVGKPSLK